MTTGEQVRLLGWSGVALSAALAGAVVWTYSSYRSMVGDVPVSMAETLRTASTAFSDLSAATSARAEVADKAIHTVVAARTFVLALKKTADRQAKYLPQHARSVEAVAQSAGELSDAMHSAARVVNVEVPMALKMDGIKPVLVNGRPFEGTAQKFDTFADRSSDVSRSLATVAETLRGDARQSIVDLNMVLGRAAEVIDAAEAGLLELRQDHLPKVAAALERSAETLRKASEQVERPNQLGPALLFVGLLLAACFGVASAGLIKVGASLDKAQRSAELHMRAPDPVAAKLLPAP